MKRRRMKDLREEVGTNACIVGKIVKSRMKWAGHMVRMKDDQLPKRSVKRDLRKAEEEEKWRVKANNREQWKQITKVAVLRSDQ